MNTQIQTFYHSISQQHLCFELCYFLIFCVIYKREDIPSSYLKGGHLGNQTSPVILNDLEQQMCRHGWVFFISPFILSCSYLIITSMPASHPPPPYLQHFALSCFHLHLFHPTYVQNTLPGPSIQLSYLWTLLLLSFSLLVLSNWICHSASLCLLCPSFPLLLLSAGLDCPQVDFQNSNVFQSRALHFTGSTMNA